MEDQLHRLYRLIGLVVLVFGFVFQGSLKAQTGDEIQLEIVSPRSGDQLPLLTNGGWPLTLRLTMDLSSDGRGIIYDSTEQFPRDRAKGWAVFSDPDNCPSFKCSMLGNGVLSCPPPGSNVNPDPCAIYSSTSLPLPDETFLEFTPDVDQPGVKDEAGNFEIQRKLAVEPIPMVPGIDISTKRATITPIGPAICSAREFEVALRKVLNYNYNQFGEVSGSAVFTLTNDLVSLSYKIKADRANSLKLVEIRTGGSTVVATLKWPSGVTTIKGILSDSNLTGMTVGELAGMMAAGSVSLYLVDASGNKVSGAWLPASSCLDGYGWGADDDLPGLVLIADKGIGVIPGPAPDFAELGRRNLAAFNDSVAYSLAEDCPGGGHCKTAVLASMVVPASLVLPTIFIDQAYHAPCACGNPYTSPPQPDCNAAYREVGGELTEVPKTIMQNGWGWVPSIGRTVKARAFVVNGTAPDEINDRNADRVIDENDVIAMGYKLISNPVSIEVELHIQEFDSMYFSFYDFDQNGEAACGLVIPAGSTSKTPPPR